MTPATALLLTALALTPQLLVLKSGATMRVQGQPTQQEGRVTFRAADGALYTIAASEVDEEATRVANARAAAERADGDTKKLKVTEEQRKALFAELAKNRAGTPAPRQAIFETVPPAPTPDEVAKERQQEWSWRNRAREFQEAVRQARENRDLMVRRTEELRSHIASLISLGYKPAQFTYDTTQLQQLTDRIPWADLQVERAERAYAQFLDDARRQDILPGWLR